VGNVGTNMGVDGMGPSGISWSIGTKGRPRGTDRI
jgi:hypothetical protein